VWPRALRSPAAGVEQAEQAEQHQQQQQEEQQQRTEVAVWSRAVCSPTAGMEQAEQQVGLTESNLDLFVAAGMPNVG